MKLYGSMLCSGYTFSVLAFFGECFDFKSLPGKKTTDFVNFLSTQFVSSQSDNFQTVHFHYFKGSDRRLDRLDYWTVPIILLDRPLWHLWTVHYYPQIHLNLPFLVERPSTSTHDWPLWLKRLSTLAQMTVQFDSRPSTLMSVHFHSFGPSKITAEKLSQSTDKL